MILSMGLMTMLVMDTVICGLLVPCSLFISAHKTIRVVYDSQQ